MLKGLIAQYHVVYACVTLYRSVAVRVQYMYYVALSYYIQASRHTLNLAANSSGTSRHLALRV